VRGASKLAPAGRAEGWFAIGEAGKDALLKVLIE